MGRRRLNRPGRIAVYFLSFLMTFSSASTYTIQAVKAASETAVIRGEESIRGLMGVSTTVENGWESNTSLKEILNQRDLAAAEYARDNNITGTYIKSEEIGRNDDGIWLSNALYEGDILRADDFHGYLATFDGADSKVILPGVNEIDVTLKPLTDTIVTALGMDEDILYWDKQGYFASRVLLPRWNTLEDIKLKRGWTYHIKLYVAGIKYRRGSTIRNPIFSYGMMSYTDYLNYTFADPSDGNMSSYMDYVSFFREKESGGVTSEDNPSPSKRSESERASRERKETEIEQTPSPEPAPAPVDPQPEIDSVEKPETASEEVKPAPEEPNPRPEPVNPQPESVNPRPEPVNPQPEPVNPRPEPVNPQPEPVNPRPEPVNPQPDPVDPDPGSVDPQPEPENPQPDPVDPNPGPVDPQPEPVNPDPTPDDSDISGITPTTINPARTFMVYMDAAGFSDAAIKDLVEMTEGSKYPELIAGTVRLMVLTGGTDNDSDWEGMDNNLLSGADKISGDKNQLWEIRNGKLNLIQDDFASGYYMTFPGTLRKFIKASKQMYPGDGTCKYDLIIWGHAGGASAGIGGDERNTGNTYKTLSLHGIKEALNGALSSGTNGEVDKLDLIAFDACNMGEIESAIVLSDYSEYLMASEAATTKEGFDYDRIFRSRLSSMDTFSRSSNNMVNYIRSYIGEKGVPNTTSGLFFEDFKRDFTSALSSYSEELKNEIKQLNTSGAERSLLYSVRRLAGHQVWLGDVVGEKTRNVLDAMSFFEELKQDYSVSSLSDTVIEKLKNTYGQGQHFWGDFNDDDTTTSDYEHSIYNRYAKAFVTGLGLFFPEQSGNYLGTRDESYGADDIKRIQEEHENGSAYFEYSEAVASYALWEKAGRLIGDFWKNNDDEAVKQVFMVGDNAKIRELDELKELADLTDQEVEDIVTAQINERIRESNITVNINEGRMVFDNNVNPNNLDHVEVRVSAGGIGLGHATAFITDTSQNGMPNPLIKNIVKFDNKWLTLGAVAAERVVSYIERIVRQPGFRSNTYPLIPVAYWIEKGDDEMSLKDAIISGKAMAGVLEVELDSSGQNGKVLAFRPYSEVAGYDVKRGDVYELLANYEESADDLDKLMSIGVFQVGEDDLDTNGKLKVSFQTIDDLEIEYRIVDTFGSVYGLNSVNFPAAGDNRNLDDYRLVQSADSSHIKAADIEASASDKIADQSGIDWDAQYKSKRGEIKGYSGEDDIELYVGMGISGAGDVPDEVSNYNEDVGSMNSEEADPDPSEQSDAAEATEQADAADDTKKPEQANETVESVETDETVETDGTVETGLSDEGLTEGSADGALGAQTEENPSDEDAITKTEEDTVQAEQSPDLIVTADVGAGAESDISSNVDVNDNTAANGTDMISSIDDTMINGMISSEDASDGGIEDGSQSVIGIVSEPAAETVEDASCFGTDIQPASDSADGVIQDVPDIDNPESDTGSSVEHVDEAPPEDKSEIEESESSDDPSGGSDGGDDSDGDSSGEEDG